VTSQVSDASPAGAQADEGSASDEPAVEGGRPSARADEGSASDESAVEGGRSAAEPDRDHPKEECGVLGISTPHGEGVAQLAFFGLFALQHRGQ
jgi:hypothetical protein